MAELYLSSDETYYCKREGKAKAKAKTNARGDKHHSLSKHLSTNRNPT